MTLPERDERQGAGGTSANLHHRHQMMQHFWRRWSKDYLHNLQTRARGARSSAALSIGDLVLVQEDHQPPMQWALGRITELYPGKEPGCTLYTPTARMIFHLQQMCNHERLRATMNFCVQP
jgi:hypothetical protein